MSARKTPAHGTRARYQRGCRCDACRAANTQHERDRKAGRLIPRPPAEHGEVRRYKQGCRCDQCRAAKAAEAREYYERNRDDRVSYSRAYQEHHCEKIAISRAKWRSANRDAILQRQREAYWADAEVHRERQRKWAREHPEYSREWRRSHPEAVRASYERHKDARREAARAYRQGNRERYATHCRVRRTRLRSVPGAHTHTDIHAQYERQRGRCYWGLKVNPHCAVSLKHGYHVDHVIPVCGERESSNGPENLVLACPNCNTRKSTKDPMDFAGVMF